MRRVFGAALAAVAVLWPGRRLVPVILAGAAMIPRPRRLQGGFGWSLFVALPFLVLFVVIGWPQTGLFTWYSSGDDWWMFQRFSYRIFMQGHWLQGGHSLDTFWFQPLDRWIAGSLHVVFGDSSVGELFWDAAAALAGAAFSFHVTRRFAGYRYGMIASVGNAGAVDPRTGVYLGAGCRNSVRRGSFMRRRCWRCAGATGRRRRC